MNIMKKNEIKRTAFIIFLASCIITAYSFYLFKKPYQMKDYKTQLKNLTEEIFQKSADKKFSGTITEIRDIKGPENDEVIKKHIIPEIKTLFLDKKSPYTLIINPAESERMIKELKDDLILRRWSDEDITEAISKKIKKIKGLPDYSADVSWTWINKEQGYILLTIKINSVSEFIEAKTEITHPSFAKDYKSKKEFLKILFYTSSVISFISLIIFFFIEITLRLSSKKALESIDEIKEKVYSFANSGQFVAAMNEVEKYLALLPDNSSLIALKNQILIKTKNNPFEGEKAFNKLKVITSKLEGRGIDRITEDDLKELKEISEKIEVENIGAMIGKIERIIETKSALDRLSQTNAKAKILLEQGLPEEALKELEKAKEDLYITNQTATSLGSELKLALPSPDIIENIILKAQEKIKQSNDDLNEAKKLLTKGEIKRSYELFTKAFSNNKSLSEAQKIIELMEKSKKSEKIILIPKKIGKKIIIIKKDLITIFRKDKKNPDIEISARTVSRDAHLKIALVGDKLIAQDEYSTYGTKIGGNIIKDGSKCEIEDGDIINFNDGYIMTAHIFRFGDESFYDETTLEQTIIKEPERPSKKGKISSIVFEGEDDRIFIMLIDSVRVSLKSTGIIYDKNGRYTIKQQDGIVGFIFDEKIEILSPGLEFEYKGIKYEVDYG